VIFLSLLCSSLMMYDETHVFLCLFPICIFSLLKLLLFYCLFFSCVVQLLLSLRLFCF
jgi:hypothetical protein